MSDPKEPNWHCSWQENEEAQDREAAALPLWRKILWLEEVHRLSLRLEAERDRLDRAATEPNTVRGPSK